MDSTTDLSASRIVELQSELATSFAEKNLPAFRDALSRGADPNKYIDENSIFELVCQTAQSADYIQACLDYGAVADEETNDEKKEKSDAKCPIHFAVSSADSENVRVLLRNSSRLNCDAQYRGKTPLHMLFEMVDETNWKQVSSCISLLIDEGANVAVKDNNGQTAIAVFVEDSKNLKGKMEDWRISVLKSSLRHIDADTEIPGGNKLRKNIDDFFPDVLRSSYIEVANYSLLGVIDPQRALVVSLETNNPINFRDALDRGANPNKLMQCNIRFFKTSVFHQACQTPGRAVFIRMCLENGADVHSSSKGKHPIHFAASSVDPENVRVLLRKSTQLNCNVKYFDATALHILFRIMDKSNWESALLCIKLLVEKGADINIPNERDQTPLAVFVEHSGNWDKEEKSWKTTVLEYCLRHTGVDIDAFGNNELRNDIQRILGDVSIHNHPMRVDIEDLVALLKGSEKEMFDAAFRHAKAIKMIDITDEAAWKEVQRKLIAAAVQSGRRSLVERLVPDDFVFESDSRISEHLQTCCECGFPDILRFLMPKIESEELINQKPLLCLVLKKLDPANDNDRIPYLKCLEWLLEDERVDVNKIDDEGYCALNYAREYNVAAAFNALLMKGAYMGTTDKHDEPLIGDWNTTVLERFLDSCLSTNGKHPRDDSFRIIMNCDALISPDKNTDIMLPITFMSKSVTLKHLVVHPVVSSYVSASWLRFAPIIYGNFLYAMCFFIYIVFYLMDYATTDEFQFLGYNVFKIVLIFLIGNITFREILQLTLLGKMYFRSLENWCEITLITSFVFLLSGVLPTISPFVVMFAAAFEFTVLVGTLPLFSISTHMEMLKVVLVNFLKCLVFYAIILVSFACCFHMAFNFTELNIITDDIKISSVEEQTNDDPEEEDFNNFPQFPFALLKTLVMLTGEFDVASINFNDNFFRYIVFVLFIFIGTIAMFNLITGLAVSDTAEIKAESEIIRISRMAETLSKYDKAYKGIEKSWVKSIFKSLIGRTTLDLLYGVPSKFYIAVAPNQSNAIYVPHKKAKPNPPTHGKHETTSSNENAIEVVQNGIEEVELTNKSWRKFVHLNKKITKRAIEILNSRNEEEKQ